MRKPSLVMELVRAGDRSRCSLNSAVQRAKCMFGGMERMAMAKNTGHDSRVGAVKERAQALNPVTGRYVKIDTNTGRIVDQKKTPEPYKGIRVISGKK